MVKTVRPKKSFGQHFLIDPAYCRRIVEFAGVEAHDFVIEIGPGTGRLTAVLLDRAAQVLGVEVDPDLVEVLHQRFDASSQATGRFELLHQDVLTVDWPARLTALEKGSRSSIDGATRQRVQFVGNLPYNISTRILSSMTRVADRFHAFTFMSQKEVAARVLASPGGKDYGYLTLLMEFYFQREKGFDVPPGAFSPPPKVMSHVMKLTPRRRPDAWKDIDSARLVRLIQAAFRHRRKTLANNLRGFIADPAALESVLIQAGIDPRSRAEAVSLEGFLNLSRVLS